MKQAIIHLITGGQRSGKSAYAEQQALVKCTHPVYLATSKIWDEEHGKRIQIHQESRSEAWQTIEEPIAIGKLVFPEQVVVLDCITLWLTNILEACHYDTKKAQQWAMQELKLLFEQALELFVVSAEIGMGVIPMQAATRQFVDLQGSINQYIAQEANSVQLMVSGIPLTIK